MRKDKAFAVILAAAMLSACGQQETSSEAAVVTVTALPAETTVTETAAGTSSAETETAPSETQTAAQTTTTRKPDETTATTTVTDHEANLIDYFEVTLPETVIPDTEVEELLPTSHSFTQINGMTYIDDILIVNKTYSVPASYDPQGLLPEAQNAFNEMQSAASMEGIMLYIVSGYRSYAEQEGLYNNYYYYNGAETDRFSARPGHSEHQTGLAMDVNNASRYFAGTPEAQWIEKHCAEYGFIVRYPYGKEEVTGFMYEPWHIRYVGKDLAKLLTDHRLTLEEYFCIDSEYSASEEVSQAEESNTDNAYTENSDNYTYNDTYTDETWW
ncbi:D-alanyl-D-alanine carboxypeptidase [Ruminococcus sp. YE71]|uniref:M15 family metallopeptidase n=1 Tax=unclassified Ruminococcus TaxID=2608920 RepID=UPI000889A60F|nr:MULTISPECIES: M15 family metallopeptidase [unclassified Ruminococcus]SDA16147.1 D-alanyl-D-alanine carboxypeptidase [Ruminococcus sp. YE78]SFW24046.1 D-alanyl-D-alanine carboxypeptidase [Ruminococcus sp. YE71]